MICFSFSLTFIVKIVNIRALCKDLKATTAKWRRKIPTLKQNFSEIRNIFIFPMITEMWKKKKKKVPFALTALLKNFEAARKWVGIKMVSITLISLAKDQGHNNSNYLQFPIPAIILLWKWTLANYSKAFRGTKVNSFSFQHVC